MSKIIDVGVVKEEIYSLRNYFVKRELTLNEIQLVCRGMIEVMVAEITIKTHRIDEMILGKLKKKDAKESTVGK